MATRRKSRPKKKTNSSSWVTIIVLLLIFVLVWFFYQDKGPRKRGQPANVKEQTVGQIQDIKNTVIDKASAEIDDQVSTFRKKFEQYVPVSTAATSNSADKEATYDGPDFTKTPGFNYPKPIKGEPILRYMGFTVSYNEKYEQASWVAYHITADKLRQRVASRDDEHFREDLKVKTKTATTDDYRRSGYDRGHLVPAADMKWSKQAMHDCFYFSNMSPQTPEFNRGIWRELEELTRKWAKRDNSLYIVTGPVLEKGIKGTIGKNKVGIPKYYYKVILDVEPPNMKAIGFVMENKELSGKVSEYAVTVDEVEAFTGLDFFPLMPRKIEKQLEAENSKAIWFKGYSGY